jgi:hypothetical protein
MRPASYLDAPSSRNWPWRTRCSYGVPRARGADRRRVLDRGVYTLGLSTQQLPLTGGQRPRSHGRPRIVVSVHSARFARLSDPNSPPRWCGGGIGSWQPKRQLNAAAISCEPCRGDLEPESGGRCWRFMPAWRRARFGHLAKALEASSIPPLLGRPAPRGHLRQDDHGASRPLAVPQRHACTETSASS